MTSFSCNSYPVIVFGTDTVFVMVELGVVVMSDNIAGVCVEDLEMFVLTGVAGVVRVLVTGLDDTSQFSRLVGSGCVVDFVDFVVDSAFNRTVDCDPVDSDDWFQYLCVVRFPLCGVVKFVALNLRLANGRSDVTLL